MLACYECGAETERPMLKKYCAACYWRVKRAAERDCGLPELHGGGRSRACPECKSYAALSSAHNEMPSKRRFIELYRANARCAITGHAFNPASDPEQLLPTPVHVELSTGYCDDGNLAFVERFGGNSMRNGHAALRSAPICARACSGARSLRTASAPGLSTAKADARAVA